jgi:hypothetical protein
MTSRRTLCALALPAFPLALLVGSLIGPTDSTDNATQLAAAAQHGSGWSAAALVELLAAVLLPLGVAGVVQGVRERGATLAGVGGFLGVLGTIGMAAIGFRHAFIYGLAGADRAQALHALDRVDHVFGPPVLLAMFCAPLALIVLAFAAARAGLVGRWVPALAILFFVSDMLPIPAAEEIQGILGIVTFGAIAYALLGGSVPAERRALIASSRSRLAAGQSAAES